MEKLGHIVTIVSYEEFQELVYETGDDQITIMEVIDSIA